MKKLVLLLILMAAVGGGILGYTRRDDVTPSALTSAVDTSYVAPPVVNEYRNNEFGFLLSMPDGFKAGELPANEDGGKTIVLQNDKGEGIQIVITSDDVINTTLTVDMIRESIPDMKVSGEQRVDVGTNHSGVAFLSDNEAFGGASREVWFYFRGNLYQISTYAHLDPLLQAMFGTWRFL